MKVSGKLLLFGHIFSILCSAFATDASSPLRLVNGFERLLIQPWGENAIRVRSSIWKDPTGQEPGAILDPPLDLPTPLGTTTERTITYNDTALVTNGILTVNITNGHLSFWRNVSGKYDFLFQELWPQHGFNARYWNFEKAGVTSKGAAQFTFTSESDEQIFGLGQHQVEYFDNKGEVFDFRNFQSELTIPFYTSSKTYGFMWNVPSLGTVDVRRNSIRWSADATSVVDYVIMAGTPGNFTYILESYTSITGRPQHLPKAAQGYIQSKNRYSSQDEVTRVAGQFKQHKISVSMIVMDFYNWAYLGDFGFNRTKFPQPNIMSEYVKNATGAELMVSVWPLVQAESPNWLNMSMRGLLAGSSEGTGVVDFYLGEFMQLMDPTNPETRKFVWNLLKQNYYDMGVKNFWIDSDEGGSLGEGYTFKSSNSAPLQITPYSRPNSIYAEGSQAEIGPLFPLYEQQMIDDGIREVSPNAYKNSLEFTGISLSRSAWLGSQRFGSAVWNGDVSSSWEAFPIQISGGLNAQLSGVAWWNTDIGGFYYQAGTYHGNISDPIFQELYVRWFQYGTFSPLMRSHGSRVCAPDAYDNYAFCPNEPWSYGPANQVILTKYINLRYTLGSYIDSLFALLAATGAPIQRPLFMDFAIDDPSTLKNAETLKLQFMFGPNLLVAPVVNRGEVSKSVYLPGNNGTVWRDWWSDEVVMGGRDVVVNASIEVIPVFYRGDKGDILAGKLFGR